MFSLDRFYHILHDNLISHFTNSKSFYFLPFGTYDRLACIEYHKQHVIGIDHYPDDKVLPPWYEKTYFHCYFYDQEPLFPETLMPEMFVYDQEGVAPRRVILIANSEKSDFKRNVLKQSHHHKEWYYFFHGFAALDWYKDFQYYSARSFNKFDKVFICYNHLISNYRSYRLHLVSNLISENLVDHGYVSFFLKDKNGSWRDALTDPNSLLSTRAKIKIHKTLSTVTKPLIIDTDDPDGSLSADVFLDDLTKGFWHVVTETIYFQEKLHLTEKSFKPIVAKRPFILVAAPGNLAYLKSYGFKTFDRWIDESYDLETDPYLRIEKITAELKKLCGMSKQELNQMHLEMQEILEFNFNHFYNDFKKIIVNELVDNFSSVLAQINVGRMPNNHSKYHQRFELPEGTAAEVKARLLS